MTAIATSIDSQRLKALEEKLERATNLFDDKLDAFMGKTGDDLLRTVIRHASGRPGPNIVTGEYVQSFYTYRPDRHTVMLGSTAPQAARLEFGFFGQDSLGRVYQQPAFPHIYPAFAEVEARFERDLEELVEETWEEA